jgi:hypothetical protein
MEQPLRCGADASGGKLPLIERKALFKYKALLTKTINRTDIEFSKSLEVDGANVRARLRGAVSRAWCRRFP